MQAGVENNEMLKSALCDMLVLRRFEERAGQAYSKGQIAGFCHLYIGQEAVVVGVYYSLQKGDSVITSYRDHAHALMAGTSPRAVMAELFGKETGVSRGKGGSMHIFDTERGFYGGHGIVGAQVPLGTGLAFAHKYKNDGNICITFYGDGAANQGQVYEAYNMAALWKLPVIYVVENNRYAMGTSVERSTANINFSEKGRAFGIGGKKVDGMDFLAVKEAFTEAAEFVRSGNGPFILEVETYRYRGHSMSDPAKYRTKEEVEEYKQLDPIESLKLKLVAAGVITEQEYNELDDKASKIALDSIEFSEQSLELPASELWTDIYVDK